MMEHIKWLYEVIDISNARQMNADVIQAIEYVIEGAKAKLPMEKDKAFEIFEAGQKSMEEGGKGFEQYYNETYGGNI